MSEDNSDKSPRPLPPADPVASADDAPADEAASLEHVVDDLGPRLRAEQWVLDQITAGKTPEEVSAQLHGDGWDAETADEIAEQARCRTRALRGVVTPEEAREAAGAHYRKGTEFKWFSAFPTFSSLWRLLVSVAYLRRSKPTAPPREAEKPQEPPER